MNAIDVDLLFGHLYFVRDRVLSAADHDGVPLADPGKPTIRDLRATLVHELDVEWSWRLRLSGPDPALFSTEEEELKPEDFATVAAIWERWLADEKDMRAWLAGLSDADLDGPCHAEKAGSHPLWFHLQHIYSHGLQQLADAATLLTQAGYSLGELDFLEFVEERERAAGARA